MHGHSIATPPEEAFAFWVPLSVPFFSNLWTAGRRREVPELRLGDAQLVDLGDHRVVGLGVAVPEELVRAGRQLQVLIAKVGGLAEFVGDRHPRVVHRGIQCDLHHDLS